ncbi:hypothetical protein BDQ17DRAFT_1335862 [Cyathus striatus]|nr:hypothetical protein BDQ17DRAFT_1335862 [Cyathus striatus]
MPGCAKSESMKSCAESRAHEALMQWAIIAYQVELAKPKEGVGKCWTEHFVEKHSDELKTSWSTPLESKCGDAVNEHTNHAWWKLLEETIEKYNIQPEHTYGVDEVGCQPYGTECEHVIGGKRNGPQYQRIGYSEKGWTDGEIGVEWLFTKLQLKKQERIPGGFY